MKMQTKQSNLEQLHADMENTFQFKNLSILDHGKMVHEKYKDIIRDLDEGTDKYEVPELLKSNWIYLKSILYSTQFLKTYHVYHDCGKPYCKEIGEDGKQRFPNHAEISAETFQTIYPQFQDKETIVKFIRNDMVFHAYTMDQIGEFKKTEKTKFIFSLWLTALAELYANKEMFDADNQLSFKIKYKKLTRSLNKILL